LFPFSDLLIDSYQQGVDKKRDELHENIPEDNHVEGLKFLAKSSRGGSFRY
jgi:hypothetical protein